MSTIAVNAAVSARASMIIIVQFIARQYIRYARSSFVERKSKQE